MNAERFCQGCGVELPPPKKFGTRKWCSERCRKASYGDPRVGCGTRTGFGAEHARAPEPRCRACARTYRHTQFRVQVEQMWADGLSARAIGEVFGWTSARPGALISQLRSRRYDLPYRNSGSAAYQAIHGADSMAHARAGRTA